MSDRRIMHKLDGRHGVVLEDNGYGMLHVHWGTVSRKGTDGKDEDQKFTEWISCHDVVTSEEPVYYGTDKEKNRALIYNPMDHR